MQMNIFRRPVTKKKEKITPLTIVIIVFLILYCLTIIALLLWGFMSAFKDNNTDFAINPVGFPIKWVGDNFQNVFNKFYIEIASEDGTSYVMLPTLFLYGFLYALGCAFAASIVPCITGYLCAKFNYKFSKLIYLIVVITMILPIVGNLPAEISMAKTFGLFDQIWGMWILKANFLGLYFIVFYNYFKSLPDAYIEAAKIDGASNMRILLQLILPMVRPLFFTVMLINFINFWNDYQVPLIYLEHYPTIAVGMFNMATTNINSLSNIPARMAAACLMLTPVLIIFLAFHKKLLGNLTMGGIKG